MTSTEIFGKIKPLFPKEYSKTIFIYLHLHFLRVLVYNRPFSGTYSLTEFEITNGFNICAVHSLKRSR